MATFFMGRRAIAGALLAVAVIPLHLLLSQVQSDQFAAALLAAIGAIYAGFGLQTGTRAQIVTEMIIALGFFSAALAGLWCTRWTILAAYAMHEIWDYAHHEGSRLAPIPLWYPPLCAVFDWVAALGLAMVWVSRA